MSFEEHMEEHRKTNKEDTKITEKSKRRKDTRTILADGKKFGEEKHQRSQ